MGLEIFLLRKIFTLVPHILLDGRSSSLFDEIIISMSGMSSRIPSGICAHAVESAADGYNGVRSLGGIL